MNKKIWKAKDSSLYIEGPETSTPASRYRLLTVYNNVELTLEDLRELATALDFELARADKASQR